MKCINASQNTGDTMVFYVAMGRKDTSNRISNRGWINFKVTRKKRANDGLIYMVIPLASGEFQQFEPQKFEPSP